MKNILMLFLIIGLLISLNSCGKDDDANGDPEAWRWETRYINNSGYTPITLTCYRATLSSDEKLIKITETLKITSLDTTIRNGSSTIYAPNSDFYDSIQVMFGCEKIVTYVKYSEQPNNPCNINSYEFLDITKNHKLFTFTFTKDMLE